MIRILKALKKKVPAQLSGKGHVQDKAVEERSSLRSQTNVESDLSNGSLCFDVPSVETNDDYHKLKTRIEKQISTDQSIVLGFVGVDPNSDVCDVVVNVGGLFAEQEKTNVLLLDGNFFRRHLSDRFGIRNQQGFAEILCDDVQLANTLRQKRSTSISVLSAGIGNFPCHGTALRKIPQLLNEWKQQYSRIIVDLGGADDSSTHELVRWCDLCYFVLPLGRNTAEEVRFGVESLRECGARFVGAVLTNAEVSLWGERMCRNTLKFFSSK